MHRTLSAPGKLFLSGEYAVLWGGTSRIAAVGPRTTAAVRRRDDREVHLLLEEGRLVGHATPRGVAWGSEVTPPFAFAARTLDSVLRAHGRETLGFSVALAPSPAGPGGRKLGMGGSARATVLTAEAGRFVLDARFDALKLALVAHALGQGMKGSGGDVAAIAAGGIVRYRRYDVSALADASVTTRFDAALDAAPPVDLYRLSAPRVQLAYAFAGESASTRALIGRVEERLDEAARARFVARSDALGDALEEGLLRGDFTRVREASRGLRVLLAELGPLETDGLSGILGIAEAYGCTGKISGAGGGDGCILFCPDTERQAALLEGLSARGFLALPLELEPGLCGETLADPMLERWLQAG
ncbi:MAG: phosphomevalonate kinase [Myxococcaceae bacterium]|nr:phosphomevalonate kinase [Myxococcaceae bacterium]MCI0669291.1 phosphomevalonate kinase [Myxococcaceae bacterium]